jgi:hypothetical protein
MMHSSDLNAGAVDSLFALSNLRGNIIKEFLEE